MTNKQQIFRTKLLLLGLLAGFAGLIARLVDLQVVQHARLTERAEQISQHQYWLAPRRGDILDVNGNILATSVPVKTVCADASLMGGYAPMVANTLAPILHQNPADLVRRLTPRLEWNDQHQLVTNGLHYVRLAQNVSEDDWQRIASAMTNLTFVANEASLKKPYRDFFRNLRLHAVFAEPAQMRVYPDGSLAGQTLGYLGVYGPRNLYANPSYLSDPDYRLYVARALSPILNLKDTQLARIMRPSVSPDGSNQVERVCLERGISDNDWKRVSAIMANLSFGFDERRLSAPAQQYLANIREHAIYSESILDLLRTNDPAGNPVLAEELRNRVRRALEPVGFDGIEKTMNKQLSGVAGWRVTSTDRQAHELVNYREEDVQPRDGLDVVLTIDSAVQHIVETALADALQKHTPLGITGIVLRPHTGEILALASLPSYDPNQVNTVLPVTRNRVITDVIEPGSTFKIVVVSGALNEGVVKLNDTFDCEHGHFAFAGRILHDHEAYGNLTTEDIIMKSSNIGAAKIGIQLGAPLLYQYARNYGFGQYTVIPLPGETPGLLYPVSQWSKVSIAQIPMGHGVAVTRLQMAMAMAAIANNGVLMQPMLISRLQDRDGNVVQRYTPQRIRQVISPTTAKLMVTALKTVVSKDGTAPEAALKNYQVAGKTGTAQKAENGAYVPGKFISSFIGFFPADDPQVCISVVMDEPKEGYYGGKVCGPVFRDIAERVASYLNLPPDPTMMTNRPSALVLQSPVRQL